MKKELSIEQYEELLSVLKERLEQNMSRHESLMWVERQAKLEVHPKKLWSLYEMERTGGESDVIGHDQKTG